MSHSGVKATLQGRLIRSRFRLRAGCVAETRDLVKVDKADMNRYTFRIRRVLDKSKF
jgi:hypothetical protein